MSRKVTDTDHGYKKRKKDLTERTPELTVGIHAAEGGDPHGDTTVLMVAIYNEFGTGNIPARSFIRAWFDENEGKAKDMEILLMRKVAKGQLTKDQAMEQLGQWAVGGIQARMAQGIPPPNRPSTVQRKGSTVPLIDTGQLRSSITYQIH